MSALNRLRLTPYCSEKSTVAVSQTARSRPAAHRTDPVTASWSTEPAAAATALDPAGGLRLTVMVAPETAGLAFATRRP